MKQTAIELVLIIVALLVIPANVYAKYDGTFPALALALIVNVLSVWLASWVFFRAEIDGKSLNDHVSDRQVWNIAQRLERKRLEREYDNPPQVTEYERNKQFYDEMMTRKGY